MKDISLTLPSHYDQDFSILLRRHFENHLRAFLSTKGTTDSCSPPPIIISLNLVKTFFSRPIIGYLTNFYRDSRQKELKKWRRQSVDRPEIELKVACDVIESVDFAKFHGSFDVTGNFELDFREISCLYLGAALDSSLSVFELFLIR